MEHTKSPPFEWLNYHHLLYFWLVAREGGLVPAARVLRLSHPTLSVQIHALEERVGAKLFSKVGRKLALTEAGRAAYRYADEIFSLGREMLQTLKGHASGQGIRLDIGVVDVVPKLVVRSLLQPALALGVPTRLVCHEDSFEKLLAGLAIHSLDMVVSDAPVPPGSNIRAFNHLLGETTVSFFAVPNLAKKYRARFPESLDGAPLLLPIDGSSLRRALDHWLDRHQVRPRVVGEFADSALLKVFGADGAGVFPAPTVMAREIAKQYGAHVVGAADGVRERFYAISVERRIKNPAVLAISEAARHEVFAPERSSKPRRARRRRT